MIKPSPEINLETITRREVDTEFEGDVVMNRLFMRAMMFRGVLDRILRGGFKTDKRPHSGPEATVETSFTPRQGQLVSGSSARLYFLMNGWIYPDQQLVLPTYAETIQANLREQRKDLSFVDAMAEATISYTAEFGIRHRNLVPALLANLNVAGFDGFAVAVSRSSNFLAQAKNGEIDESQRRQLAQLADHSNFVGVHQINGSSTEIRCLGKLVGISMMFQAMQAATELAEDKGLMAKYDPTEDLTFYAPYSPGATPPRSNQLKLRFSRAIERGRSKPIRQLQQNFVDD